MVKEGRALRAESRGRVLSSFLRAFFPQYVDYGFTASLEDRLDDVSGPALSCLPWNSWESEWASPRESTTFALKAQGCHAA